MTAVVHLTSAHPRYDNRIYLKECRSLATAGYDVSIVVADGQGCELTGQIKIHDVGRFHNRMQRLLKAPQRVYEQAVRLNASLYHIHDPELIPVGVKLKRGGSTVIFDAHEDLPRQLLTKPYLGRLTGLVLANVASFFEKRTCSEFDAIIAATPAICDKFREINSQCFEVCNYPSLAEVDGHLSCHVGARKHELAYIGVISRIRGAIEMIDAMERIEKAQLNLAGTCNDPRLRNTLVKRAGWSRVNELGQVSREEAAAVRARSVAGIVTFLPAPNHLDAQPNKMFEYMGSSLPVIASNFPLWHKIVQGNQCGLCVDPTNPDSISRAITRLLSCPEEARMMGANGHTAVLRKYNWDVAEKELLKAYRAVL